MRSQIYIDANIVIPFLQQIHPIVENFDPSEITALMSLRVDTYQEIIEEILVKFTEIENTIRQFFNSTSDTLVIPRTLTSEISGVSHKKFMSWWNANNNTHNTYRLTTRIFFLILSNNNIPFTLSESDYISHFYTGNASVIHTKLQQIKQEYSKRQPIDRIQDLRTRIDDNKNITKLIDLYADCQQQWLSDYLTADIDDLTRKSEENLILANELIGLIDDKKNPIPDFILKELKGMQSQVTMMQTIRTKIIQPTLKQFSTKIFIQSMIKLYEFYKDFPTNSQNLKQIKQNIFLTLIVLSLEIRDFIPDHIQGQLINKLDQYRKIGPAQTLKITGVEASIARLIEDLNILITEHNLESYDQVLKTSFFNDDEKTLQSIYMQTDYDWDSNDSESALGLLQNMQNSDNQTCYLTRNSKQITQMLGGKEMFSQLTVATNWDGTKQIPARVIAYINIIISTYLVLDSNSNASVDEAFLQIQARHTLSAIPNMHYPKEDTHTLLIPSIPSRASSMPSDPPPSSSSMLSGRIKLPSLRKSISVIHPPIQKRRSMVNINASPTSSDNSPPPKELGSVEKNSHPANRFNTPTPTNQQINDNADTLPTTVKVIHVTEQDTHIHDAGPSTDRYNSPTPFTDEATNNTIGHPGGKNKDASSSNDNEESPRKKPKV